MTWAEVLEVAHLRRAEMPALMAAAEANRHKATYNTGSILEDEAFALLALATYIRARVVIEVGTFIGTSTTALAAAPTVEAVYTCDVSNDCLPSTDVIHAYPKQTSTQMLRDLMGQGVRADLCFYDGALSETDAALIARVTRPTTVHAFHDYNYGPKQRVGKNGAPYLETMPRKGIGNVHLLRLILPNHRLIEPLPETTLALLVPR